ncbi:MAG: hypothetical protein IT204_16770 [Fimbriimonadaceae bacterium]|nr:hypothetical protein [Fimbriimonadaceae bacterium]
MPNRIKYLAWTILLALPLAAGAVQLRYGLQVGQELRYRETLDAKGSLVIDSALGEQAIPLSLKASEERTLKTISQAGEAFWLESRSLGGKASYTYEGQTQQQDIPEVNYQVRMTTLGDVLETRQLAGEKGAELDLRLDSLLQAARLAAFPPGDVQVGGTWDKEIPIRTSDGKRVTGRVSNTLLRLRTVDGRPMADIQSRYEVPIPNTEGTMAMAGITLPIRLAGKSSGTTTTVWDLQQGRAHYTTGSGAVDLQLWLLGLTTDPAKAKFDLTMGIALTRGE